MDDAEFGALVRRLEQRATAQPTGYRLRVLGLAALGYGYMVGVLLLLVALAVVLVLTLRGLAFKLVVPLVVVIAAVARALWVRMPAPEGIELRESDAPRLFELVRTLQRRLDAPRVDTILIVPDLNAAIVQLPRLGLFGWYRNYLLIGLPLLQALDDTEWQAVLAHELGHLSGRHGRFGAWIYRTRVTWGTLLPVLEASKSTVGRFLFSGFSKWYGPWFNAYTFVLARAHEYEADGAAAEVAGAETAVRALLRIEVAEHVSGGFWDSIQARVKEQPDPPRDAYQQLRSALVAEAAGATAAERIAEAWRRETRFDDTHPALADRLRALGWPVEDGPPPVPEPLARPSAASVYLGATELRLAETYGERWAGQIKESWQARYQILTEARATLTQLDDREAASLSIDEEWQRIAACRTLGESERIEQLCVELLAREPAHVSARFSLGRVRLERGDPGGVAHMEEAMRQDADAIVPGCLVLMQHFEASGQPERVEHYRKVGLERQTLVAKAEEERRFMTPKAPLEPHDWSPAMVASLQAQLARFPQLGEAYLARRVVTFLPETACYVLCILPRTPWWAMHDKKRAATMVHSIATTVEGPVSFQVYHLVGPLKPMRRRLMKLDGARVV